MIAPSWWQTGTHKKTVEQGRSIFVMNFNFVTKEKKTKIDTKYAFVCVHVQRKKDITIVKYFVDILKNPPKSKYLYAN